jgi:shikimate kinase/3-dehydroquinate synthase
VSATGPKRATVLVGFMGSGKSAAARSLAAARGKRAIDSDRIIERDTGRTIAEIFDRDGEPAFRAIEERIVCELLETAGPDQVLALGGGAVMSKRVRKALEPHLVVWLDVAPAVAWRRAGGGDRPLARDRAAFETLYAERRATYEAVADAVLPDAARQAVAAASRALEKGRAAPAGTRMVWAASASGDYPVWVGEGILGADLWPIERPPSRRFLVSDENVAPLWAPVLGELDGQYLLAAGEASKTIAGAERVWHALVGSGMTRSDHVVALGGGVVGDLAGFCAATYQRGIPVVQVPTSVVAQVDSAFGGKTGVDLPQAKNYVGVYHQPAAVIVDVATLATLPAAERAAGYGEVLKTALIAGGSLWRRVAAGAQVDQSAILDCIRCKLAVVAADERDGGLRQVLNLGHTIGHGLETATGYRRFRHGEAVGLGLLGALRLSGAGALRDQVQQLLAANGLPVRAAGVDAQAVLEAIARDKKRGPAGVPLVLVEEPGRVRPGVLVPDGEIEKAVVELTARTRSTHRAHAGAGR